MKKNFLFLLLSLFLLTGCAELTQVLNTLLESASSSQTKNTLLSETDIIAGLKEALTFGVEQSVADLSGSDGYFSDESVKILLPPETDMILENVAKIPGGQYLIDKLMTGINDAASDAAAQATPILTESINDMTFSDAVAVLAGADDAATKYLKQDKYNELMDLYQPQIQSSLDKVYIEDVSPQNSWDELTGKWNEIAGSIVGRIAGLQPVETDLSRYLTGQALDGLFLKIADSEKNIRKETSARVTPLLERVFSPENISALLDK